MANYSNEKAKANELWIKFSLLKNAKVEYPFADEETVYQAVMILIEEMKTYWNAVFGEHNTYWEVVEQYIKQIKETKRFI